MEYPSMVAAQNSAKSRTKWVVTFTFFGVALVLMGVGIGYILFQPQKIETPIAQENPAKITTTTPKVTQKVALPTTAIIEKKETLDPKKLPLGDGKTSTTTPAVGSIYTCSAGKGQGGAGSDGNWISSNTWDSTKKLTVKGDVTWSQAQFQASVQGNKRVFSGNGLPVGYTTGTYPISYTDPAYVIDRNPNSIKEQNYSFSLPLTPQIANRPSCVPGGMIGVSLDGVAIFNGVDDADRDAVAHEVQDKCGGHPQQQGVYHYHGPSFCQPTTTSINTLVGYALDGFGIYSLYDEKGIEVVDSDLDTCHGKTSNIIWDGKLISMYHYVLTREYPYSIGCFKGTPIKISSSTNAPNQMPSGPMPTGQNGQMPPPQ